MRVARYEWPAFGGQLSVESDAKWNKQQYLELVNAEDDLQPSYVVANARVGLHQREVAHWEYVGVLQELHRSMVSGI